MGSEMCIRDRIYKGPLASVYNPNTPSTPYRRERAGIAYGYNDRLGETVYRNPSVRDYFFSLTGGHLSSLNNPADLLLLSEASTYVVRIPASTGNGVRAGGLIPRHFNGVNIAFADGHVKWIPWNKATAYPVVQTNSATGFEEPASSATEFSRKLWLPDYSSP